MAEILYSIPLNLSDEYAEQIETYCQEHNLRLTKRRTDNPSQPKYFLVWGTKRELKEFQQYF